jgi:protein-L-isoaspartate(D-aspartate) O-methyltransferase
MLATKRSGFVRMAMLLGLPFGAPACAAGPGASGAAAVADATSPADQDHTSARRHLMVERQIEGRGIRDPRVLTAVRKVPRHRFVPPNMQDAAYEDSPLPIGFGQTISQPYIVAYMSEVLQIAPHHRVLEIGTGSGYQAAILGELAKEVYTIEIVPELGERATRTLADLGYTNVHVRIGDGYLGWPEHAPFDRVMVTAAPDHVPQPLVDQLGVGGRLVLPVGRLDQWIRILTRTPERVVEETTIPVRFVPLVRKPGE